MRNIPPRDVLANYFQDGNPKRFNRKNMIPIVIRCFVQHDFEDSHIKHKLEEVSLKHYVKTLK